jgi:hypothetical protein
MNLWSKSQISNLKSQIHRLASSIFPTLGLKDREAYLIETSARFATFLNLLLNLRSPKSHSDGQQLAQKSNLNLYKYLGLVEV